MTTDPSPSSDDAVGSSRPPLRVAARLLRGPRRLRDRPSSATSSASVPDDYRVQPSDHHRREALHHGYPGRHQTPARLNSGIKGNIHRLRPAIQSPAAARPHGDRRAGRLARTRSPPPASATRSTTCWSPPASSPRAHRLPHLSRRPRGEHRAGPARLHRVAAQVAALRPMARPVSPTDREPQLRQFRLRHPGEPRRHGRQSARPPLSARHDAGRCLPPRQRARELPERRTLHRRARSSRGGTVAQGVGN